jgi:hypothetical protein
LSLAGASVSKIGLQIFDGFFIAADHHAVALFQAPHAARRADIDKLKALGGYFLVAAMESL